MATREFRQPIFVLEIKGEMCTSCSWMVVWNGEMQADERVV